jgi:hypothetical protein
VHAEENPVRFIAICIALFVSGQAFAADINIFVDYRVHAVRVSPKPSDGIGKASIDIVLHEDGTAEDVVAVYGKNAKTWELKKRAMGHQKSGVEYHITDNDTIERTFADTTFFYIVRVTVDGKSCKAQIDYKLKPNEKEYVTYSTELGVMAHYSLLEMASANCTIRESALTTTAAPSK